MMLYYYYDRIPAGHIHTQQAHDEIIRLNASAGAKIPQPIQTEAP